MKSLKQIGIAVLILGIMFLSAPSLRAEEPGRSRSHQDRIEKLTKELDLSAEQQTKIKEFQGQNSQKAKELHSRLKEKRKELQEELDKTNSDPARINSIVADIKDTDGAIVTQQVNSAVKMKEILTPEQYQKFKENMKKMHKNGFEKKRGMQKK